MRTHLGIRWLTGSWRPGFLLAACLCLGGVAVATPLHSREGGEVDEAVERFREALLSVQRAFIEPVEADRLVDAALAGMRDHLDRHTHLLSPRDLESLQTASGRSVGLGADLDWDTAYPRIRDLYAGSPAERAGLRPADRLLTADGVDLASIGEEAAKALLKGHEGDTLTILALNPAGDLLRVTATFSRLDEPALEARRLHDGQLGYLLVRRFSRGVTGQIEAVLNRWTLDPPKALVIDLRDCPGGFLDEGIRAADLFLLPGSPISYTRGRLAGESVTYRALTPARMPMLPVAVLVDSLTASSAELFAGALQGNGRAVLVGEPTYGKRTIQRIQPMSGGGAMKVTSAWFGTPADTTEGVRCDAPPCLGSDALGGFGSEAPGHSDSGVPSGVEGGPANEARRGLRLEPDRRLTRQVLPAPFESLRAEGLLQRFLGDQTLFLETLTPQSPWRHAHPAATLDRLSVGVTPLTGSSGWAPGGPPGGPPGGAPEFRTWLGQLADRLAAWGCSELASVGALDDSSRPIPAELHRFWMLDWAEERWGTAFSAELRLETDPWVTTAWNAAIGSTSSAYLTVSSY